ncbi:MAG: DUF1295 domain-containing protein [Candidatus Lokiarchaeota archaeon]|nr:DUF1295 domain-containing protein [Candidatus Lokiarchaeota archaeon]
MLYNIIFLLIFTSIWLFCIMIVIKKEQVNLFDRLFNSTIFNTIIVICWVLFAVILIPFAPQTKIIGDGMLILNILGLSLFILGILVFIWLFRQKRGIGSQEMDKLLTTGAYGLCRHPIYLGHLLMYFGLAFQAGALDALILSPIIISMYVIQAKIEEKYSIGKKFEGEYEEYRKNVPMYMKSWIFAIIVVVFLIFFLVSINSEYLEIQY